MVLIEIDIEYQTMKSLLNLLYQIAQQRKLASEYGFRLEMVLSLIIN